jgi:hypothetical protein
MHADDLTVVSRLFGSIAALRNLLRDAQREPFSLDAGLRTLAIASVDGRAIGSGQ